MRGCSWPFSCPSTILAYSCYSSQFVAFCNISRLSLPFSLCKCRILLNLLFLLFLPYLLLNLFTYSMKNSCCFFDFCEICGLTEALLGLFSFKVQNFVKFVVLAIFAIFVAQSFNIGRKILVTFAIFAKFVDFSKPSLTFSLSKCRILGNLLFLLFLPYLLLNLLTQQEKALFLLRFSQNLWTFRSPS